MDLGGGTPSSGGMLRSADGSAADGGAAELGIGGGVEEGGGTTDAAAGMGKRERGA